jgi:hypothetical protein
MGAVAASNSFIGKTAGGDFYSQTPWMFVTTNGLHVNFFSILDQEAVVLISDGLVQSGFDLTPNSLQLLGDTVLSGNGGGLGNLQASSLAAGGILPALDGSSLTNLPGGYVTISAFQATITNYARIVTVPTNYTAAGNRGEVAFGWQSGTNFVFWFDVTSNRWQRAKSEVWQ